MRAIVFWDYIGVPLFWETTNCYQYVMSTHHPVFVTVRVKENKDDIRVLLDS